MKTKEKKKVGRPPKPMPEKIDATAEEIAEVFMKSPPRRMDQWKFLKQAESSE